MKLTILNSQLSILLISFTIHMKIFGLLLLLSPIITSAQVSQVESFNTISGQPFFPKQYQDVNGTPYLFEEWTPSTIVLENGSALKDVRTNFNLVTNELLYLDEQGKTMVAKPSVIRSVEVKSAKARKFITTHAKNSYLEVVSSEGKATLLKHQKKVILETKPYNSATVQKNFKTSETIMVEVAGNLTEVKSTSDLLEVLTPAEELKDFAKEQRLKSRSVDSWVKIVDHYNTL